MGDVQCGADAVVLGRLGHRWTGVPLPRVEVALPSDLAAAAVEAWERDDPDDHLSQDESPARRLVRHRADILARIGAEVAASGRPDKDVVHVELDAALVALAVDASEDLPR